MVTENLPTILVVDDEPDVQEALTALLGALVRTEWNQTQAAKLLSINRNTLIVKMQQYGLKGPGGLRRRSFSPAGGRRPLDPM